MFSLFRKIILANELSNSTAHIYKFSDPDGVRSGKSGWSFGICQYDTQNNPSAILCLRECGFTTDEIRGIKDQTIDVRPLEAKLQANKDIVDKWDNIQLRECLMAPLEICNSTGVIFAGEEPKLHVADYHNQFYLSRNGKCHTYLLSLKRPVTSQDILNFKLTTAWGKKSPGDVKRRYNNIVGLCRTAGLA